ncbi:hypothetical protein N0V88_006307 [Collariella sp. IMI 366227]|nr:hypothetical protein N0V88_006307 [Collariella sp. IMI 366227]
MDPSYADFDLIPSALRSLEDEHITSVIHNQLASGLRSVTDGEFRRRWFHIDFLKQLHGVEQRGSVASTNVNDYKPDDGSFPWGREAISEEAYPTLEGFFDDLVRVYQEEIAGLYEAGCRFVQLDDTNLAYLCDEKMRAEAAERHGEDPLALTRQYADLINRAVGKRPRDMVCGFSSTVEGNELTEEQQWAKVRLEVEIAKEVWGEDLSV